MPRTSKQIKLSHPVSTDPQNLLRLPASTPLTKPQRSKSKSLQPCRCSHEGCGKIFSKRSNLKAHMRIHSGVLPYPCHFPGCTKRFRWKSSLKPHIRVHLSSGQVRTQTSLSDTAISSYLLTDTQPLNYSSNAQKQPASYPKPIFVGRVLDTQGKVPTVDGNIESGSHSPASTNVLDMPRISDGADQTQDTSRRIEPTSSYPPHKPLITRVLPKDSHDQPDHTDNEQIDLTSGSMLSSSATFYETDVIPFSLGSPMEEMGSVIDKTQTEHLWKSDIQVMDPFGELSLIGNESYIELLSGLEERTEISEHGIELRPSDSQWMFSSEGSTVSSIKFSTTLKSLTLIL